MIRDTSGINGRAIIDIEIVLFFCIQGRDQIVIL